MYVDEIRAYTPQNEQEAADQFAFVRSEFEFMVADNHLHAFLVSGVHEPAHHGGIAEKFNIDYIGTAFGEYRFVDFSVVIVLGNEWTAVRAVAKRHEHNLVARGLIGAAGHISILFGFKAAEIVDADFDHVERLHRRKALHRRNEIVRRLGGGGRDELRAACANGSSFDFDGFDGPGLPALDTIHRIDRTRLAFELINGARLSDACGRDCGGESGTDEMTALHKGALFF